MARAVDYPAGAFCWTELYAPDPLVAGAHAVRPDEPVGWQVSFRVADVDATAATAERLGGLVVVGPMDIPIGRLALIADPYGSSVSVTSFEAPFAGVDGS